MMTPHDAGEAGGFGPRNAEPGLQRVDQDQVPCQAVREFTSPRRRAASRQPDRHDSPP